jgi:hypothetical protein
MLQAPPHHESIEDLYILLLAELGDQIRLRVDRSGSGSGSGRLSINLPFIEFYRSLSLKRRTVPHVKNVEKYRSHIRSIAKPCLPSPRELRQRILTYLFLLTTIVLARI